MTDEITLEDKQYISSKRASELTDYAQDYVGQLARGGFIEARRVGGLWYVSLDSLNAYKVKSEDHKQEPPKRSQSSSESDEIVSFDGKHYVSASRAAKITGYNQDYIGQLARAGKILSRQVGNRWYVDHNALIEHKKEKDGLLAAVQAESVGIAISTPQPKAETDESQPFFTYASDERQLMPTVDKEEAQEILPPPHQQVLQDEVTWNKVRIHRNSAFDEHEKANFTYLDKPRKKRSQKLIVGTLIIVMCGSLAFLLAIKRPDLYQGSLYGIEGAYQRGFEAGYSTGFAGRINEFIEDMLAPQLNYVKQK